MSSVIRFTALQLLSMSMLLWNSDPSLGPYPVTAPDLKPTNVDQLLSALDAKLQQGTASSTAPPAQGAQPPVVPSQPIVPPAVVAPPAVVPAARPAVLAPTAAPVAAAPAAPVAHPTPAAPARHKRDVGSVLEVVGDAVADAVSDAAAQLADTADVVAEASDAVAEVVDNADSSAEAVPAEAEPSQSRRKRDIGGIISEISDTVADVGEHVSENAPIGTRLAAAIADTARGVQAATATDQQSFGTRILGL